MVDNIKNQPNLRHPQSVPKKQDQTALRQNFKSISSGLSVSQVVRDAPAVVHVQATQSQSAQVGKVVSNLNDAVKSSKKTLKALEDVTQAAEDGPGASVVRAFAEDLDALKADIVDLLETLRMRADRAAVLGENMQASEARLEDVEKARAKAESMGSGLQFKAEEALEAHRGITPDSVARLLQE
jgi:flagellin-like hook-associated protein FlgL